MLCRVFNIGKGDETGVHMYLDPETKRRNGELEFSTHTWAVKPLSHPYMPIMDDSTTAPAASSRGVSSVTTGAPGGRNGEVQAQPTDTDPDNHTLLTGSTNETQKKRQPSKSTEDFRSRIAATNLDQFTKTPSIEKSPVGGSFGSLSVFLGSEGSTQSPSTAASFTLGPVSGGNPSHNNPSAPRALAAENIFGSSSKSSNESQVGGLFSLGAQYNDGSGLFGGGTSTSSGPFGTSTASTSSGNLFGLKNEPKKGSGLFGGVTSASDTSNLSSSSATTSATENSFSAYASKSAGGNLFGLGTAAAPNPGSSTLFSQGSPASGSTDNPKGGDWPAGGLFGTGQRIGNEEGSSLNAGLDASSSGKPFKVSIPSANTKVYQAHLIELKADRPTWSFGRPLPSSTSSSFAQPAVLKAPPATSGGFFDPSNPSAEQASSQRASSFSGFGATITPDKPTLGLFGTSDTAPTTKAPPAASSTTGAFAPTGLSGAPAASTTSTTFATPFGQAMPTSKPPSPWATSSRPLSQLSSHQLSSSEAPEAQGKESEKE